MKISVLLGTVGLVYGGYGQNRNTMGPVYGVVPGAGTCVSAYDPASFKTAPKYSSCDHAVNMCNKFECDMVIKINRNGYVLWEIGNENARPCNYYPSAANENIRVAFERRGTQDICGKLGARESIRYTSQTNTINRRNNLGPSYGPVRSITQCVRAYDPASFKLAPKFSSCDHAARICYGQNDCDLVLKIERNGQIIWEIGNSQSAQCNYFPNQNTPNEYIDVKFQQPNAHDSAYTLCQALNDRNSQTYQNTGPKMGNNRNNNRDNSYPKESCGYNVGAVGCFHSCKQDKRFKNTGKCESTCGVGGYCCRGDQSKNSFCPQNINNAVVFPLSHRHYCLTPKTCRNRRSTEVADTVQYGCANLGGSCSEDASMMCSQQFDSSKTAELACKASVDCEYVVKQGKTYQIWTSQSACSVNPTEFVADTYEVPKDVHNLYEFTTIVNHAETPITQVQSYNKETRISELFVPRHLELQQSKIHIFHETNLQVNVIDTMCIVEQIMKAPRALEQSASHMVDYELAQKSGNMKKTNQYRSIRKVNIDLMPEWIVNLCEEKKMVQVDTYKLEDGGKGIMTYEGYANSTEPNIESQFHHSGRVRRETKTCSKSNCSGTMVLIQCSLRDCSAKSCLYIPDYEVSTNAPISQWNHIGNTNMWCLPCCLPGQSSNRRMGNCFAMPDSKSICRHFDAHGRCGDEFH